MNELTNFVLDAFLGEDANKINEYSGGESIPNDGNATTGKQWNNNWKEYDSQDYYLKGLPDWNFVDKKPSNREQESAVDQKLPIDNQNDGVTTKYNRILKQNFPMPYINEMIRHEGDNWVVYNKNGTKKLGTHTTKKDALKQLRAIEIHKHESIEEATPNDTRTKAITRQIDLLSKKRDILRDKMSKDYANQKKAISNIEMQIHKLEDSQHGIGMSESMLSEAGRCNISKEDLREFYRKVMKKLKIKPLPVKFQFVKQWGINTQYELETFKPISLIIDPIRILKSPAELILHEIAHHIKLVREKNPYRGDDDKSPEFLRLERKLRKKFMIPEYTDILKCSSFEPKQDKTPKPIEKPEPDTDKEDEEDEPVEKPTKVVKSEKPEPTKIKKQVKKEIEPIDKDDEDDDDRDVKNVSNKSTSNGEIEKSKKRRNQDLTKRIKNPDTGKLIKIKSALRYPKDTRAHQAAMIALRHQVEN